MCSCRHLCTTPLVPLECSADFFASLQNRSMSFLHASSWSGSRLASATRSACLRSTAFPHSWSSICLRFSMRQVMTPPLLVKSFREACSICSGHSLSASALQCLARLGFRKNSLCLSLLCPLRTSTHSLGMSGEALCLKRQAHIRPPPGSTPGQSFSMTGPQRSCASGLIRMSFDIAAWFLNSAAAHSSDRSSLWWTRHVCTRPRPAGVFLQNCSTSALHARWASGRTWMFSAPPLR
mmetsp:Transcript_74579/g.200325  ORF Transcript_74579/g.200325 Transcript_74579/m.200325 type:complete len:237 (-) Transcript_74579:194-904(-)